MTGRTVTTPGLPIGEVARRSGLATSAIRYYQELGLVSPVGHASGRRRFDEAAAGRLRAITAARQAGFSLDQIRRLLDSQAEGSAEWRELVADKITEVRARIERLQAVEATLRDSLTCGCRAWDECPLGSGPADSAAGITKLRADPAARPQRVRPGQTAGDDQVARFEGLPPGGQLPGQPG